MTETLFFWCFAIVVATTIVLTALQVYLVDRMQNEAPRLYKEAGSPGAMYFLAGSWLGFGRYVRMLLRFEIGEKRGFSSSTARVALATSLMVYALILGWVIGILSRSEKSLLLALLEASR